MTSIMEVPALPTEATATGQIGRLRALAMRTLARMYQPKSRRFVFRLRKDGYNIHAEGSSLRYTAITALGLLPESRAAVHEVLCGDSIESLIDGLVADLDAAENLGDLALIMWVALASRHPEGSTARARLAARLEQVNTLPTVETAWALTALCQDPDPEAARPVRQRALDLLLSAYVPQTHLFRHHVGSGGFMRSHVACFADLVYPIQALAACYRVTREERVLEIAECCGGTTCHLLGEAGQWWWHYDVRTGCVLENYPVYAVHQDAMAPMALFALGEAGGTTHDQAIRRGLAWLAAAPEIGGKSLVDESADLIWRKVARREPGKLVRHLQTIASAVHPALRWPGVDEMCPAETIDYECRPYHLGWLLYAWPEERATAWDAQCKESR